VLANTDFDLHPPYQVGEVGVERGGILGHDLLGVDEVTVRAPLH
jgi:hypothetical protein